MQIPNFIHSVIVGKIELEILKRKHDSKLIFVITKEKVVVSIKNILRILEIPSQNRRKKFFFKDKSLLDYNC